MDFKIKLNEERGDSTYKTLYIKQSLVDQIAEIAKAYNTSWNNVVVSMIESCLKEE